MAKREPLGKDPLEWIKRTKPADEEKQQTQFPGAPGAPPSQRPAEPPGPVPPTAGKEPPTQQEGTWLDSIVAAEKAAAPSEAGEKPSQPEIAPGAVPDLFQPEEATRVQVTPGEEEAIQVQVPEPPSTEWPAAVVQDALKQAESVGAVASPEEEEPTEVVSFAGETEEATGPKLVAEKKYIHVGSTDNEVSSGPRPDSYEYASLPFPARQEPSLLFPIIMIVCIFLMGLLVSMWAADRINRIEKRIQKIEKLLEASPSNRLK